MKNGNYRRIEFTISHDCGYGRYKIEATYYGRNVKVYTTDAELYDYIDDDTNRKKMREARRTIYNLIRREYENTKEVPIRYCK